MKSTDDQMFFDNQAEQFRSSKEARKSISMTRKSTFRRLEKVAYDLARDFAPAQPEHKLDKLNKQEDNLMYRSHSPEEIRQNMEEIDPIIAEELRL